MHRPSNTNVCTETVNQFKQLDLPNNEKPALRKYLFWAVAVASVSIGNSAYVEALLEDAHKTAQTWWDTLLAFTGDDPFTLYVFGTSNVASIVYWGLSLSMLFVDVWKKPHFIAQYKIQTNHPLGRDEILHVLKQSVFNQIVVGAPFIIASYFWFLRMIHPLPPVHTLPSFGRIITDILICLASEEVVFYYIHRLLHHRRIYKYIHKKHHEWTNPIAIAAGYSHPVEYLVGNLVPIFSGLVLTGSHVVVVWLWMMIINASTCNDHGGYHFPFLPSQEFHYFHHLQFNNCFGLFGIMDYLHGTDKLFRNSAAFKRHFVSFSVEPLGKKYPNDAARKSEVIKTVKHVPKSQLVKPYLS